MKDKESIKGFQVCCEEKRESTMGEATSMGYTAHHNPDGLLPRM